MPLGSATSSPMHGSHRHAARSRREASRASRARSPAAHPRAVTRSSRGRSDQPRCAETRLQPVLDGRHAEQPHVLLQHLPRRAGRLGAPRPSELRRAYGNLPGSFTRSPRGRPRPRTAPRRTRARRRRAAAPRGRAPKVRSAHAPVHTAVVSSAARGGADRPRAATTSVRSPSRARLPTSSSIQSEEATRSAITDSAPLARNWMAPVDSSRSSTPIRLSSDEKGISPSSSKPRSRPDGSCT